MFWKLWLTFVAAERQDDSPANWSLDKAWVYCSSCCSTGAFRGSTLVREGGVRVLDKAYRQEIVALLFTRLLIRHCKNTEYCHFCNLVICIIWTSFWYLNYILVFAQYQNLPVIIHSSDQQKSTAKFWGKPFGFGATSSTAERRTRMSMFKFGGLHCTLSSNHLHNYSLEFHIPHWSGISKGIQKILICFLFFSIPQFCFEQRSPTNSSGWEAVPLTLQLKNHTTQCFCFHHQQDK